MTKGRVKYIYDTPLSSVRDKKEYDKYLYNMPRRSASLLFRAAKLRAKKKDWPFNLTKDWIETKIEAGTCEVTGLSFDLAPSKKYFKNPWAPSLDRVDSFGGYTKDNCRIVVSIYNHAAGQWGDDILMVMIKALIDP